MIRNICQSRFGVTDGKIAFDFANHSTKLIDWNNHRANRTDQSGLVRRSDAGKMLRNVHSGDVESCDWRPNSHWAGAHDHSSDAAGWGERHHNCIAGKMSGFLAWVCNSCGTFANANNVFVYFVIPPADHPDNVHCIIGHKMFQCMSENNLKVFFV